MNISSCDKKWPLVEIKDTNGEVTGLTALPNDEKCYSCNFIQICLKKIRKEIELIIGSESDNIPCDYGIESNHGWEFVDNKPQPSNGECRQCPLFPQCTEETIKHFSGDSEPKEMSIKSSLN